MFDVNDAVKCIRWERGAEPLELGAVYRVRRVYPEGAIITTRDDIRRTASDCISIGIDNHTLKAYGWSITDIWPVWMFRKIEKLSPDPEALSALKSLTVKRREPVEAG
ncbi:hypothetical protein [Henriciella aquimarina]|uniref:hypothetical protein n=1 Tax=Henriciella aquimarina TaxID=545261 RepID=UPI000A0417A0|nr:hypothetical protein [Henriciella aquimarina]